MNWDAIGAIGEILGGLAVLVTLIYLARQVRENTRSIKVQTDASINEAYRRVEETDLNNPQLSKIRAKAESGEVLSNEEELLLSSSFKLLVNARYAHWKAHKNGLMLYDDWGDLMANQTTTKDDPKRAYMVEYLEQALRPFPKEFRDEIMKGYSGDA